MRIGFCGTGNMASAIATGIITSEYAQTDALLGYNPDATLAQQFTHATGVQHTLSVTELTTHSDLIIIAVKPDTVGLVIQQIVEAARDHNVTPTLVSIAAGLSLETLREHAGTAYRGQLVRVMPNLNVTVNAGMSAVCAESALPAATISTVLDIFNAVGHAVELPEKHFSAFTAIAGSSPAYTFLFIDSLARGAVKHGMAKDVATAIAAQAVLGSALQIQKSDRSPWDLIDAVSSPGGTTVAGLLALEDRAFISTVVAGVEATIERDIELGHP